ncbi:MAG: NAD(P)/FAD-dependent oxidoreductase [Thiobacillaceae bacterium]|nr:NAD(P)/FAD-dependent oxidoreductase [Thiobacillaceae bacterium]
MHFNRRDFLTAGAAVTAAGILPSCAGTAGSGAPHVIVVGAGYGGATCAKYIRKWDPKIKVTVIEPNDKFVSCPISNWVLGGMKTMADITHSYDTLRSKYGIDWVKDTVIGIDVDKRQVRTAGGQTLNYDRLVLAPGVEIRMDTVEGYKEAHAAQKVVHAWKAGPETALLRRQLEAMPDGGVYVLSVPTAPYRCPPGPYERACLVASYFKKHKPRSKIILLDGNQDVASKPALFKWAWKTYYDGMIDYRPNNGPKRVDMKTMTVHTEFDDVKGDVLNVVPAQRAGEVTALAGARNDSNKVWCVVDFVTFESTAAKNVHIIGDSVLSNHPKSGHMATNHAKVCASAIVELLNGRQPDPVPVVANTCYSAVSDSTAGHVATVFRYNPEKKQWDAQPGGGASAQGDEINFIFNWAWAENVWAEVLT